MDDNKELEKELRNRIKIGIKWEDLFTSLLDPKYKCNIPLKTINLFLSRVESIGKNIITAEKAPPVSPVPTPTNSNRQMKSATFAARNWRIAKRFVISYVRLTKSTSQTNSPTHRTAKQNWSLLKNMVFVMKAFEEKGVYEINDIDDITKDIDNYVPKKYTNEEMFNHFKTNLNREPSSSPEPSPPPDEIEGDRKGVQRIINAKIVPEYEIPEAVSREVFDEAVSQIQRESDWFESAQKGSVEDVKHMRYLANKDPNRYYSKFDRRRLVNAVDNDNCTALYIACQNGNLLLAQTLIELNTDPRICAITNIKPPKKESPLKCCARWGYVNIMSII